MFKSQRRTVWWVEELHSWLKSRAASSSLDPSLHKMSSRIMRNNIVTRSRYIEHLWDYEATSSPGSDWLHTCSVSLCFFFCFCFLASSATLVTSAHLLWTLGSSFEILMTLSREMVDEAVESWAFLLAAGILSSSPKFNYTHFYLMLC